MLRSMPTMAPTNALTTTSNENCATFSRSPRRTAGDRGVYGGHRHALAFTS